MYIVKDKTGEPVAAFKSYMQADGYRNLLGNPLWTIEKESSRRPTPKQIAAIRFCESMTSVPFMGDINDYDEVCAFLGCYLEDSKNMYRELQCEYDSYINDLD